MVGMLEEATGRSRRGDGFAGVRRMGAVLYWTRIRWVPWLAAAPSDTSRVGSARLICRLNSRLDRVEVDNRKMSRTGELVGSHSGLELAGTVMADHAADSLLIPQLPDDLSVQCIARVPRSSHPALALVSRSWRSFLRSPRLFALRSHLGATEPSLCISIDDVFGESRWFFLNLHPCRLLPLPLPPFPAYGSTCAVLGPSLYLLGGDVDYNPLCPRLWKPSSAVQIFDPHLNLWTTGPSMAQPRILAAASTLGTRIYIFGGYFSLSQADGNDAESGVWAEVLDPASGAWTSLPRPPTHLRTMFVQRSGILGGKILLDDGLMFDPEAAQPWRTMAEGLWNERAGQIAGVDGVLYMYSLRGKLEGYDPAARVWRPVEGVEGELPEYMHGPKLTNWRGLLCLVWIKDITNEEQEMERITRDTVQLQVITPDMNIPSEIHCMGVEITRTRHGGFRGSIAWRGVVGAPISHGSVMHSVVLEF